MQLRFAFKKHLTAPATDLTPKAVKATLNAIVDDGKKAIARLTGAYGRACYGWAIGKDLLVENPFARLKLDAVASRERVLSDEELVAIWGATKGPGAYNAIVRMLILTGQRREEVAGMTWGEIAPDLSTWTIPAGRTKNGVAHIVPLPPQAQAIISSAHRMATDDGEPEFVFRGLGRGLQWLLESEDRAGRRQRGRRLEASRSAPHDGDGTAKARRSARSDRSRLNHVSGSRAGIVGVYQRHEWADEKRAALDAWGEHVAAIVEGRTAADNVTRLRRSARWTMKPSRRRLSEFEPGP